MIVWATDYWYLCLGAFVIGAITAAWIWLRANADEGVSADIDEPRITPRVSVSTIPAPALLEPVRPFIEPARPVTFVAPALAATLMPEGRPNIAAAVGAPDDLTLIKGVGPKLHALLNSLGVARFDQISSWSAGETAEVDDYLGNFKGRIARDAWIEQARLLARGDHAGFAAKFGELGGENKR